MFLFIFVYTFLFICKNKKMKMDVSDIFMAIYDYFEEKKKQIKRESCRMSNDSRKMWGALIWYFLLFFCWIFRNEWASWLYFTQPYSRLPIHMPRCSIYILYLTVNNITRHRPKGNKLNFLLFCFFSPLFCWSLRLKLPVRVVGWNEKTDEKSSLFFFFFVNLKTIDLRVHPSMVYVYYILSVTLIITTRTSSLLPSPATIQQEQQSFWVNWLENVVIFQINFIIFRLIEGRQTLSSWKKRGYEKKEHQF